MLWDGLYECVEMVVVGADLDEMYVISILDLKKDVCECFDDTVGQNFPPVLNGEYHVVQETGFVVALRRVTVFHATNIPRISLPPKQSFGAMFLVYRLFTNRKARPSRRPGTQNCHPIMTS